MAKRQIKKVNQLHFWSMLLFPNRMESTMINNKILVTLCSGIIFLKAKPVVTFRDQSSIPPLNGWNLSIEDDEKYLSDTLISNSRSQFHLWDRSNVWDFRCTVWDRYVGYMKRGIHVGFYDLIEEKAYDENFIFSKLNRHPKLKLAESLLAWVFIQKNFLIFPLDI